jgi:hypothetical protein
MVLGQVGTEYFIAGGLSRAVLTGNARLHLEVWVWGKFAWAKAQGSWS